MYVNKYELLKKRLATLINNYELTDDFFYLAQAELTIANLINTEKFPKEEYTEYKNGTTIR